MKIKQNENVVVYFLSRFFSCFLILCVVFSIFSCSVFASDSVKGKAVENFKSIVITSDMLMRNTKSSSTVTAYDSYNMPWYPITGEFPSSEDVTFYVQQITQSSHRYYCFRSLVSASPYYAYCVLGRGVHVLTPSSGSFLVGYYDVDDVSGDISNKTQLSSVLIDTPIEYPDSTWYLGSYSFSWNVDAYLPSFNTDQEALVAAYSDYYGDSSSASAVPVSTSYMSIDTGRYVRATESGKAGFALWSPDNGSTLRGVVATIDPSVVVWNVTDSSSSAISLIPVTAVADDVFGNTFTTVSDDALEIGYFSSFNDAVQAIYDMLIDSGSTPVEEAGHSFNYSLPPGYVMFLDITGIANSPVSLVADLLVSDMSVSSFNSETYVALGQLNSIPESPFTLPVSGTSKIDDWSPASNGSLFSTYSLFSFGESFYSNQGQYVCIVNPYFAIDMTTHESTGIDVQLTVNAYCNSAVVYSLQGTLTYVDGDWQQNDVTTNDQYSITYDDEAGVWNTDTSAGTPVSDLPYGGSNSTFPESFETTTTNFLSWLKGALSNIGSALDAGKSAIMTLVGYASGFFGVIGALYSWLPVPVYSVLVSAIVLAITIGIIKVFI